MQFNDFLNENSAKIQKPLSWLIRIILIFAIIYSIYFHLWRILFINILLLIIILIPSLTKRMNVELPAEIEFVLAIFTIVSFFLGDFRGLIIQIFFGLAIGFIGFALMLILYKNSRIRPNYILITVFSLSFSLALGAFSELSKYYLKVFLKNEVGLPDYNYAMASLTLVLLGALFASIVGFIYMKGAKIKLMQHIIQKFKNKNPNLFVERTDSPDEVLKMIKKGENEKLEFKSTLSTNLYTHEIDKKIELSALKTISAFLNTEGGTLLIGVSDNGEILGIEKDRFQSNDKFSLHFTNLIKECIGNQFLPYFHFELVLIENKNIMKVDCSKSEKPVFLKFEKEEEFYSRLGSATVQLTGSKLVEYIDNNFKKK